MRLVVLWLKCQHGDVVHVDVGLAIMLKRWRATGDHQMHGHKMWPFGRITAARGPATYCTVLHARPSGADMRTGMASMVLYALTRVRLVYRAGADC